MIKINKYNKCKTTWRGTEAWNTDRRKSFVVRIFGVKVFEKNDDFESDPTEVINKPGFKTK